MRTAREALVGATNTKGAGTRPLAGPCRRGTAALDGDRAAAVRPTGEVGAVPRPRGSIRDRQPHPLLRARHLGPPVRPVVTGPVRRPRGGPPAGGDLRTGGQ